ncbi:phage portal protein [Rhodococcus hoagii]|nr:phage portal protein [Prescottella equi]
MGLASWLGFKPMMLPPEHVTAEPILELIRAQTLGQTPEQLWREQPYLRTVITFLARNIAQLGLHTLELAPDGGRQRVRTGPLAELLKCPNESQTGYELVYGLVADLALYDTAYLMVTPTGKTASGWELRNVPPRWVTGVYGKTSYTVEAYAVTFSQDSATVTVPAENMLVFHGWNPTDPLGGVTAVDALKHILIEQIQAQTFREQLWERGGRVGTYLTRPKDAPQWSNEGRSRFKRMWSSAWSGPRGSSAGGTPVLEDGMELKRVGFSAKEEEYIEASKLALTTVAAVYHVNPTMLGLLDNANYSNVREFRRMLYGDTLGPILAMIEARLNAFLLPKLGVPDGTYVEFNIREKLEGSFEEQGAVMQQAIGGPWMTVNEGRAKQNLPAIEGGDELIRNLSQTTEGAEDVAPVGDEGASEDQGS